MVSPIAPKSPFDIYDELCQTDKRDKKNVIEQKLKVSINENNEGKIFFYLDDYLRVILDSQDVWGHLEGLSSLLGHRLHQREYQELMITFLILLTHKNTQMILESDGDLLLKKIFSPYFSGDHYQAWKKLGTDKIVRFARSNLYSSVQLYDYFMHWVLINSLFSDGCHESHVSRDQYAQLLHPFAFEFLKQLYGYDISISFFNRLVEDVICGPLTDDEVSVLVSYLMLTKMTGGRAVEILIKIYKNCPISPSGLKEIQEAILLKFKGTQKLLFNDVWNLTKFMALFGIDERLLKIFEKKICLQQPNKNGVNSLSLSSDEINESFMILDRLSFFIDKVPSKENLIEFLLAIAIIHLPVFTEDQLCEFLEKIALNNNTQNRGELLLILVVGLVSQSHREGSGGKEQLISRLAQLQLFKNSDLKSLLRRWDYLSQDFKVLSLKHDSSIELMCPVLGITEREFVLLLYANSIASVDIQEKLIVKSMVITPPSDLEKTYILQIVESSKFDLNFLHYLKCLYVIPLHIQIKCLRKFLRLNQDQKIDYKIFIEMIQMFFTAEMVIEYQGHLFSLLRRPFTFNTTFHLGDEDNRYQTVFEEFNQTLDIISKMFENGAVEIISSMYFNWIEASNELYINLRKNSRNYFNHLIDPQSDFAASQIKYYVGMKKCILKTVADAYDRLIKMDSNHVPKAQKLIGSMNRPITVQRLPNEPTFFKGISL